MVTRSLLHLLLLTTICISPAAAATLSYTGDLLLQRNAGIPLCVQGLDDMGVPVTGEPFLFSAVDVYNISRLAPMSYGQPNGAYACLRPNLQAGVYEFQASGMGVASDPVALTVMDTTRRDFMAWSAELPLKERGQSSTRIATFGLYLEFYGDPTYIDLEPYSYMYYAKMRTQQFLFLDPDAPGGPVRIRIQGFQQAYGRYRYVPPTFDYHFIGYCEFTVGSSAPVMATCHLAYYTYTKGFQLDVLDYARRTIYHAGGWPQNQYWWWYM